MNSSTMSSFVKTPSFSASESVICLIVLTLCPSLKDTVVTRVCQKIFRLMYVTRSKKRLTIYEVWCLTSDLKEGQERWRIWFM